MSGKLDSREAGTFSIEFVRVPYGVEREIAEAYRVGVPDADAYAIQLRTSVYRGDQKRSV